MTGKELIIYILQKDLYNEKLLLTTNEKAAELHVGEATVVAWHSLGVIIGIEFNGELYFLP